MKTTSLAVTVITVLSTWVAADDTCAASANQVCPIKLSATNGPNRRCGRYARLKQPSLLSTCNTASSVDDCGAICHDNRQCKSFSFDQATSACTFYDKSLPQQRVRDTPESSGLGSNTYSRRCYSRGWVDGDGDYQLVQNPGFEGRYDGTYTAHTTSWYLDIQSGDFDYGTEDNSYDGTERYYMVKDYDEIATQAASLSQSLTVPSGCASAEGPFSFTMDIGQFSDSVGTAALATAANAWSLSLVLDDVVFAEITQICSADQPCTPGQNGDSHVVWRSITVAGNYIGKGNPSPKFEIRFKSAPDVPEYWVAYVDNALLTFQSK